MFTRKITVKASDASCKGTIKLKNLLDYFQDTAGLAVEDIEGTTSELAARGYAWILTRYEIEFTERLPRLDERFLITTFHDPSHGYNTLRIFDVKTPDGKSVIKAKTSWLLINLTDKKPVKPAAHLPEILTKDTEEINPVFQEIKDFEDEKIIKSVEIPVRFHDLDYNSHVNNAVYFAWVFDECPADLMTHGLKSICASFRSGAKIGEKVTLNYSNIKDNEKIFLCRIRRDNVKKSSALFQIETE